MPNSLTLEIIQHKTNISDVSKVKRINLWGLNLTDISILSEATSLELLSLTSNQISNLSPLKNCLDLKELYLRKNSINDIEEIRKLNHLENLRILWLSENPCSEINNYRLKVIKELPSLYKLDDVEISAEERQSALELENLETIKTNDIENEVKENPRNNLLQKNAQVILKKQLTLKEANTGSKDNGDREDLKEKKVGWGDKKKKMKKKMSKWNSRKEIIRKNTEKEIKNEQNPNNINVNKNDEIFDELDKLKERYTHKEDNKKNTADFGDNSKLRMISIISDKTQKTNLGGFKDEKMPKVDKKIDAVLGDIVPEFSNKYKATVVLLDLIKLPDLQFIYQKINNN